jgi:hypothetical protein
MPFRNILEGTYDEATLHELQDIFEFTWLVIADNGQLSLSREDVARMIIEAHKCGLAPETIKDEVLMQVAAPKAG